MSSRSTAYPLYFLQRIHKAQRRNEDELHASPTRPAHISHHAEGAFMFPNFGDGERSKTSKQNTISARQEHAPVINLNIEATKRRVSAPRQIGEAQQDFNCRASAARRFENAEHNIPQMVEASTMVETQSMPAGYSHPAFAQEVRGQVNIVPPAEPIVLRRSTMEE